MNAVIKGKGDARTKHENHGRRHELGSAFKAAVAFSTAGAAIATATALIAPFVLMCSDMREKPGLMEKQKNEQTAPVKLTAEEEQFGFARGFMGAADTLFNRGSYKAAAEAYGVAANGFKKLGYTNLENEAYGKQVAAYDAAIRATNERIKGGFGGSGMSIQDDYWNNLKPLQADLDSLSSRRDAAWHNYGATKGRPEV